MKNIRKISLLLLSGAIMLTSCARRISVNYQADITNTGKVILKPNKPTSKTFITINDNLIVNKKNVKSVTVNNVPTGEYAIHYTSENSWYKEKLNEEIFIKMEANNKITKLVEVPPYSTGYWIYVTGISVLPWLALLAL